MIKKNETTKEHNKTFFSSQENVSYFSADTRPLAHHHHHKKHQFERIIQENTIGHKLPPLYLAKVVVCCLFSA